MSIVVTILGTPVLWPTQGDTNYSNGTTQFVQLVESALEPIAGLYNTTTGNVGAIQLSNSNILTYTVNNGSPMPIGAGTVTSVDVSGGTTGLTTSGGPITGSGTITLDGTLGVANGGTGATTLTGIVRGNGTSPFTTGNVNLATEVTGTLGISNGGTGQTNANDALNALLPTQTGNNGRFLTTNGTNTSWAAVVSSPAGSDTQIQYNNAGAFGASSGLTWNNTTRTLTVLPESGTGSSALTPNTLTITCADTVIAANIFQGSIHNDNVNSQGLVTLRRSRGTAASPTALQTNDILGTLNFQGHTGSTYISPAFLRVRTTEDWSAGTNRGTSLSVSTTTTGGGSSTASLIQVWSRNTAGTILELPDTTAVRTALGSTLSFTNSAVSSTFATINLATSSAAATDLTRRSEFTGGTSGQVFTSAGAGNFPTWTTPTTGTVTSVDGSGGTTGLSFTGGPVTSSGTLTLGGTLGIANGGTGQTTANAALNALLPSQTSQSGKVLSTDGTNTSWVTAATGSVTSVTVNGSTGRISSTGSPITTSGTITLDLEATAVTPASYTYASITVDSYGRITAASNGTPPAPTPPAGSNTQIQFNNSGSFGASSNLTWNGSVLGVTGDVTVVGNITGTNLSGSNTGDQTITLSGDVTGSGTGAITATLANTAVTPASYTYANITVDSKGRITAASSGTAPVTSVSGTSGRITSTGGATPVIDLANTAVTPASYTNANITVDAYGRITAASNGSSGTVTSVDVSGGTTGLTTSGGPITGSGTITLGGTLGVANGGTGATTLTGVLKGNGTSPVTAGNVNLASEVTGTLPIANGGTNITTYATGDILYASATNTLSKLAAGTNGHVLTLASGVPTWAAGGGGGSPLTTKGDLYTYDTANARLPVGTNGQVLTADSAEATGLKWATPSGGGSVYYKDAVRAATTANITLSGTFTVDGVSLAVGDRILVKNQSTQSQNGIYVVASGAWSRASDFDNGSTNAFVGSIVPVNFGTLNRGQVFRCTFTSDTPPIIGTSQYRWAPIGNVASDSIVNPAVASAAGTLAIGQSAAASGVNSVSLGQSSTAGAEGAVAVGNSANASGGGSVAIGGVWASESAANTVTSTGAVAIGTSARARANDSVAIGYRSLVDTSFTNGTAVGRASAVNGIRGTAIGNEASAYEMGTLVGSNAISFDNFMSGFGAYAYPRHRGETTFGGQYFSSQGDVRSSVVVWRARTTNNTPTQVGLNSTSISSTTINSYPNLLNDTSYIFDCDIIARNTATDTESKAWNLKFAIRRGASAANTALIGTETKTVIGEDTGTGGWDVSVTADTTNGRAKIDVTGENSKTINWVVNIRLTATTG